MWLRSPEVDDEVEPSVTDKEHPSDEDALTIAQSLNVNTSHRRLENERPWHSVD